MTDLDKIEALTDWCRAHVSPPPADLLYDAAGAVANMRHAAGLVSSETGEFRVFGNRVEAITIEIIGEKQ